MFHYITLGTNDLPRARAFYDAVMATIEMTCIMSDETEIGYGPCGATEPQFWINRPFDGQPASVGNGSMPAFRAVSRAAVDTFHAAALAAGGTDEGAPGPRYRQDFYACYIRDPDGNKLSALCLGAV